MVIFKLGHKRLTLIIPIFFTCIVHNLAYAASNNSQSNAKQIPHSVVKKLNVNTATLGELIEIKGLGKIKAKAILDYIQANGKLVSLDELVEVKGVGQKTVDKIRNRLTI